MPAQTRKSPKVGVVRMDLGLVFQGKGGNMGVGNQVPAHPGLLKRFLKNF